MASGADTSQRIAHYIYLSTAAACDALAAELRQRGFEVESQLSADEANWLVLASHRLEPGADFQRVRDELEDVAQRHSGQYDGWRLAI